MITQDAISRFRRCIYNRWFYGFLAAVCLLDVTSDALVINAPGQYYAINLLSLICSGVAAVLTASVFLDLVLRRK